MDLEKMRQLKEEKGWTSVDIAVRSGVPISTVYKVLQGQTDRPRKGTLEAIERALTMGPDEEAVTAQPAKTAPAAKAAAPAKKQEAVSVKKLLMVTKIVSAINQYIDDNKEEAIALPFPVCVQFADGKALAQPDVVVVTDFDKIGDNKVCGAPDLVIEIAEKGDKARKPEKLQQAGVREYWVIDLSKKTITANFFGSYLKVGRYTFADEVPVSLFRGKCKVDFASIDKQISKIFSSK